MENFEIDKPLAAQEKPRKDVAGPMTEELGAVMSGLVLDDETDS